MGKQYPVSVQTSWPSSAMLTGHVVPHRTHMCTVPQSLHPAAFASMTTNEFSGCWHMFHGTQNVNRIRLRHKSEAFASDECWGSRMVQGVSGEMSMKPVTCVEENEEESNTTKGDYSVYFNNGHGWYPVFPSITW